jgi:hypothetical protein
VEDTRSKVETALQVHGVEYAAYSTDSVMNYEELQEQVISPLMRSMFLLRTVGPVHILIVPEQHKEPPLSLKIGDSWKDPR